MIGVLSVILFIAFTTASVSDPGYLTPELPFIELLENIHPGEMCAECRVLTSSRSRHCTICNRCVERYDHHCPWINTCVGIGNHNSFLVFINTLMLVLICIAASSVYTLVDECHPKSPDH